MKQFVRENRLAQVTAAADRLHAVLSPPAGQPRPTGEQIRDAVREAFANRGPDEVDRLRDLYRERWLKGAKGGEPRDLDKEIFAKLGDNLWLRKQCEAVLHPPARKSERRNELKSDPGAILQHTDAKRVGDGRLPRPTSCWSWQSLVPSPGGVPPGTGCGGSAAAC